MLENLHFWGLNAQSATLEVRETLANLNLEHCLLQLKQSPAIDEVVILSTCHRFEIFIAAQNVFAAQEAIYNTIGQFQLLYNAGTDVVPHVMQVSCGLNSQVLGEQHITHQIKAAFQQAQKLGCTGSVMNTLFQQALKTTKAVRTYWQQAGGLLSYEAALWKKLNYQGPQKVLILGLGQLGSHLAQYLKHLPDVTLYVSTRNALKGQRMAQKLDAQWVPWNERYAKSKQMSVIFSAVSTEGDREQVFTKKEMRILLRSPLRKMIDLGMPRTLPEAAGPGEYLSLEQVFRPQLLTHDPLIQAAERMIMQSTQEFVASWKRRQQYLVA